LKGRPDVEADIPHPAHVLRGVVRERRDVDGLMGHVHAAEDADLSERAVDEQVKRRIFFGLPSGLDGRNDLDE